MTACVILRIDSDQLPPDFQKRFEDFKVNYSQSDEIRDGLALVLVGNEDKKYRAISVPYSPHVQGMDILPPIEGFLFGLDLKYTTGIWTDNGYNDGFIEYQVGTEFVNSKDKLIR